jgi:hypothetical protein
MGSEYQDGKCTNGEKKCCDRECVRNQPVPVCGSFVAPGCILRLVSTVMTPVDQQTGSCAPYIQVTTQPCSTNCADCVASWAAWSSCSVSCTTPFSAATQSRVRNVTRARVGYGRDCPIPPSEMRACDPQPPVCCSMSPWSLWSACSSTCAPAQKQRTRTVVQPSNRILPCPASTDIANCALPPCDAMMSNAPTQSTPQPQIEPPPPGPTILLFQSMLVDNFDSPNPQSVLLPYGLGEMRAILANQPSPLEQPYLTASDDSIGCQSGAMMDTSKVGVAAAPHGFRFEFNVRRAFARMVVVGLADSGTARLVGFDRGVKNPAPFVIAVVAGDTSLPNDGGFDTWELYADGNSSLGLQAFEIYSAIASLPTTTTTTTTLTDTTDSTIGNVTNGSDDVPIDESTVDNSTTIIIAVVVTVLLLLMAVGIIWVARRRQVSAASTDLDMSKSNFPKIDSAASDRSYGNLPLGPPADYDELGLETMTTTHNLEENHYTDITEFKTGTN